MWRWETSAVGDDAEFSSRRVQLVRVDSSRQCLSRYSAMNMLRYVWILTGDSLTILARGYARLKATILSPSSPLLCARPLFTPPHPLTPCKTAPHAGRHQLLRPQPRARPLIAPSPSPSPSSSSPSAPSSPSPPSPHPHPPFSQSSPLSFLPSLYRPGEPPCRR